MSKAKKMIEWGKTALIVLLTVSALLLGWQTGIFNDFLLTLPVFGSVAGLMGGGTGTAMSSGTVLKEAARPLSIVITNEEGERYGIKYDVDERNATYERTRRLFTEAFGSASVPQEISEEQWRESLGGAGVFFEYATPIRLSVLDKWLGAQMPETMQDLYLRRMFVAFGEDRSRLYYQDHSSSLFYGTDTVSSAGKAQELENFVSNGAVFAYETGITGAENAPYMLLIPGSYHPNIRAYAAGSPDELLAYGLTALGHVNELYRTYFGPDNTLVCVGTQFRIMMQTDGRLWYRRTDGLPSQELLPSLSKSEMIEAARMIVFDSISAVSGNAEVFFESYEQAGDVLHVHFGYFIAGGRVHMYDDRHAAMITFTSGIVTEVDLNFRNFIFSGEYTRLLPERQTLAAAGNEFMLYYSDTGAEILHPSWVKSTSL